MRKRAGERNPGEITTAAIAERMKLTQGALFRHFPSKDALWEAVMRWVEGKLFGEIDKATGVTSSVDALKSMFMAHIEFVNRHPGVPRMLFAELQKPDNTSAKKVARSLLQRYAKRLKELLEQGVRDGALDSGIDPGAASGMFIGTVQGLVMQLMISGEVEIKVSDAEKVFMLYLRGIKKGA
ncbi:MAG: TetR/AcrR family transcriptional regulator [Prosthecochloris sp.]|nr:TetR/AcrR family transcriptional regulator [Prosthecochloris sp.]